MRYAFFSPNGAQLMSLGNALVFYTSEATSDGVATTRVAPSGLIHNSR